MKAEAREGNQKGIPPSVPLSPTHWRQRLCNHGKSTLCNGIRAELIDAEMQYIICMLNVHLCASYLSKTSLLVKKKQPKKHTE